MQSRYLEQHGVCLLCTYVGLEHNSDRAVCENDSFLAVVPFWAAWPFETIVISKRHVRDLTGLDAAERWGLGAILRDLTRRYDALFGVPFPYSMGFHQSPARSDSPLMWHVHAHFYPPLLRSAEVRKFMVGYELLAGPQRDLTPETAAWRLRSSGDEMAT